MDANSATMQMQADNRPGIMRFPLHRILLIGIVVYFLVFGLWMANIGGQPDQTKHLYYSRRFAETWGIPKEDLQSAFVMTGKPYIYYWLNGIALKLFRLLVPSGSARQELFLLRIMSLCMASLALVYLYKLASKVTCNPYAGALAAFFMANTLMFVFVSSGVSYDNFMNLASAAAIYHLVNAYKGEDYVRNTALMGIWLCLGCLAKEQALLLAFIVFVLWLAYSISARKRLVLSFNRINVVLAAILLISSVLFLDLYGVNVVRYRHLIPQCPQIKTPDVCTLFKDRRPLYHSLDIRQLWNDREVIPNPFSYLFNFWLLQMLGSIWGIISHNSYVPWLSISLHGLLILWAAICVIRYWKLGDRVPTVLLLVLLSYIGFVLLMNYWSELHFDFRHFGVQGRYLSPVLGILITLMINYFLRIPSLFLRRMTLSLALIVYFAGGIGLFIFRYSQVFSYWKIYF
jgi:hypothetical protein